MRKVLKVLSSMLVFILILSICTVGLTAYASTGDVLGDYKFNITSTYEDIDWDSWKQYKAETHVHTVRSDADTEVDDMIEYYYGFGYDAMALTDHGTVNYGWTSGQSRIAIFSYQVFVHGAIDELSAERYTEITTGTGAVEGGTEPRGYGMREIPLGIELNGMSTKKCHINGYYVDYGHGELGTSVTWPRDAVAGNYEAGGLTHINHVGEWTDGNDDISVYDADFISDFASIYQDYGIMRKDRDESNLRGCLGMELVNTADSRTHNDRYLYDEILKILAPQGINVLGFCEDDAHELSDCDRNAQYFIMPENDIETNNIKHSMMYGEFYCCSKNSKNSYELGDGFVASGEYPSVSYIGVEEVKNQIVITSKNANKIRLVADGEIIETYSIDTAGETTVFDLNSYESQINSYVRIYLTGPGGILYLQPFLVEKETIPVSSVTFIKPSSDTIVNVFDSNGSLVQPINTDDQYVLDAGDYTYIASRPGYITTDPIAFTVTQSDIDYGTKRDITVTLEEDSNVVYTYFYVPETIYLNMYDSKTFSSYLDRQNDDDGAINTGTSKIGNIYFHRTGASNISITYEVIEGTQVSSISVNNPLQSSTETLSTSIVSGAMSSALDSNGHSVIKWTATYNCEDKEYKSYAYTYIYSPLKGIGSVAAAGGQAKTKKNILGWAHDTMHITSTIWLSGVHYVTGGNCAYRFPISTTSAITNSTDVEELITNGIGMTTESDDSSGGSVTVSPVGGTGTITIDPSRYSDLNQIPNLCVGFDINNCTEGEDTSTTYVKVGDKTLLYFSQAITDSFSSYRHIIYIDYPISTSDTSLVVNGYVSCAKENRTDAVNGYVTLALNYVDKAELREDYYNKAIKFAYQSFWFDDSSDYEAYVEAIKEAGVVLGNPMASKTDVSNAETAISNMFNNVKLKSGTLTINHIDKNTNAILKTEADTYKICDTIIASATEFTGYDYSNMAMVSNGQTVSAGSDTFTSLMATEDNYTVNIYYAPKEYTIQYIVSDSSFEVSEETVIYGSAYTISNSIPTQNGYTFEGWYLEADGNIYQPGDSFVWNFDKNSALTPQWSAKNFTATYNLNGGTGIDILNEAVSFMDSFTITNVIPKRTGYVFSGWLAETASGTTFGTYTSGSTFSWTKAEDITFTAQWTAVKYLITFEANGGTLTTDSTVVTFGEKYGTLPLPVKEGYNFDGWFLDNNYTCPVTETTTVTTAKDHTLYAKWSKGQFKITYYLDGEFYTETTYNYGDTVVTEASPVVEGYEFSGWSEIPETMPAYNITVNGTLTAKCYTIKYVIDGLTYSEKSVTYGTKISAPIPEAKKGYTFSGWDYVPSTMPAKNVTVTGSYVANKYTLTYYVDNELYKTEIYSYNSVISPIQMANKTGYTFSGWSYIPSTMPDENVFTYGSYVANKYTLTYYVDGEKYYEEEYEYNQSITPYSEPQKDGYTFSGWSNIPNTMPAMDYTVNGTFETNEYSYFFVVDNEVRSDLTIKAKFGEPITTPEITVSENYSFSGWSPKVPATMGSQSMYFYGTTVKKYSTINYSLNGGSGVIPTSERYVIGETIDLPSSGITKAGYIFYGWSEDASAQNGEYTYNVDNRDVTLYAVWKTASVYIDPAPNTETVVDDVLNIIYGIKERISQSDFFENFIDIFGNDGEIKCEKGIAFGTGSKIKLYENDTLVKTYEIVVYGDVDGDGVADGMDVQLATMIKEGNLSKTQVGEAVWEAADCNHDGNITDEDIQIIIESGIKLQVVDQTK